MTELPSYEEMEKDILKMCESGFKHIPLEERKRQLEDEEEKTRELHKKYQSSYLHRITTQFTI